MALYPSSRPKTVTTGKTEFELLKSSHKFLREDDEDENNLTWEDKLASKYYSSLYREFAVCDLKHYKSGNFALRWRTEAEVLSGAGESSCGNTRCKHHQPHKTKSPNDEDLNHNHGQRGESSHPHFRKTKNKPLITVELPFAYIEHGEPKSALVKVVLCEKCLAKLMWKRRKEKELALGKLEQGQVVKKEEEDGEVLQLLSVQVKQEENDDELEQSIHRAGPERSREDRVHRWEREQDIDIGNVRKDGNSSTRRRHSSRSRSPHLRSRTKERSRERCR
ncbi:hypothetical protein D9758_013287 [Tetrapyrgos nigripes]|uniref:Protein FRA10AC1 n=1 Tax=Tetrapyrgos nigripes TaxID=182062 RepID=A0A8H5CCD7_9AGAR|nr:hypothetical protein D9758_013287 [Tetrapyrgos nigripes]